MVGPCLQPDRPAPSRPPRPRPITRLAEHVAQILSRRGLTFAKLSRDAERLLPDQPRCRIPRNFHNDLVTTALSPDIFQLFTLSAVSGYRLADWLRLFGFSPEEIPHLQLSLPAKRTALVSGTRYQSQPEFRFSAPPGWSAGFVCPLAQFLRTLEVQRISRGTSAEHGSYLYARVGREDAFAFPGLLPGSLVRVDTRNPERWLPARIGSVSHAVFVVEHSRGLACCRLRRFDEKRFAPQASELPYAQVPLELGSEARLLGVVDLELRRLSRTGRTETPQIPPELATFWKPEPLAAERKKALGGWIRAARVRSGLHLREASYQSARIAELLEDSRYFIARGSLSAYERLERPPRHVHKMLSLCVLYGLALETFLEKLGLPLAQAGRDPFPNDLLSQFSSAPSLRARKGTTVPFASSSLVDLVAQSQDLPPFLASALRQTGESVHSMHDIFWVGGSPGSFHSRLEVPLFAAVDRRRKRPKPTGQLPSPEQSIYILLRRDGRFLCGRTALEGHDLLVQPFSDGVSKPVRLRNRVDAEVVGQVVGVIRRVPRDS